MHDWQHHVDEITQQVLRIETQSVSGTGFVHYARRGGTRCIATARHVVVDVLEKKESFRVWHGSRTFDFGKDSKGFVVVQQKDADDSAVIAVIDHDLPMPRVSLASPEERREVRIGMEVGWLGFPALDGVNGKICFFSGRISFVDETTNRFLIDGTAVHGCSGGPVFCVTTNGARIIGALSSYIPNANNMPKGGYLPGLTAAVNVSDYKGFEKALDQIPNRERSLKIKLDECPKCSGTLAEQLGKDGQPDIVCQSGCGALVDLLDQDFVRNAPGGAARLRDGLVESFRRVIDR